MRGEPNVRTIQISMACAVLAAMTAPVQAALIDFDGFSSGTSLTNQYASQGILFSGFENGAPIAPEIRSQQFVSSPASSPNYLTNFFNFPSTSTGNRLDEIRMDFTSPVENVSMIINTAGNNTIQFDLYDFSGTFLSTQLKNGNSVSNVPISLTGTNIGRISAFQPSDGWWWTLDDLSFDAAPVPEPSSFALLGMGALGFIGCGWRRKRKQAA